LQHLHSVPAACYMSMMGSADPHGPLPPFPSSAQTCCHSLSLVHAASRVVTRRGQPHPARRTAAAAVAAAALACPAAAPPASVMGVAVTSRWTPVTWPCSTPLP
jgi:hypothetical protein